MRKQFLVFAMIVSAIIFLITCRQTERPEIASSALVSKYARPLTDVVFSTSPARLERGKYLANGILSCFHCHAASDSSKTGYPPFPDKLGSGKLIFKTDSTHVYAPNISPDKETGAGNWTDDMFVRALRNGIGHDGRALVAMPWWIFMNLADEDIASVIVYLRSIPPIKNKLPGRLLMPEWEKNIQSEERPMDNDPKPQPDTSTLLARGKYLVTVGECEGCHTAWYMRNPGFFGGGNPIVYSETDSVIVSPNISSDITGIGGWDDETFIRVIRTGKGGILHSRMPWITYRNISDADLSAILAALKSLPPVKHQIVNRIKPSLCEVCGVKHGYGDQNKISPIIPVKVNTNIYPSYAGTYANKYKDTAHILLKDKKLWVKAGHGEVKEIELIPVAENEFQGSGLPSSIIFIKNQSGKITGYVDQDLVPMTYVKTNSVQ
jgi:Cytochrome C oxidase, cbb3-type, subunit III